MTRIAFLAGTYQPQHCGVAHYTAHLRQELANRGISSIVLTTRAATGSDPTVRGAVNRWHITELLALLWAIHRSQADSLHIQHAAGTYGFDRAIFLLPLLLRLSGWRQPIITTIHEYGWWEWQPAYLPAQLLERLKEWGQQRGWWDREDGFLLTHSDAIITTNHQAEQVIRQRLPQKPLLHHIPIAANVEPASIQINRQVARQTLQQTYGWNDTAIIAFFSFLHPVKGIETLLSAFQQVVKTQPDARLLLIGGVESLALPAEQAKRYWQKLQTQIQQLNLTNLVQMTGYLAADQVSLYLTAADLGVLPFHTGVTLKSGSLLAMMAHGLPIVATQTDPADPNLAAAIKTVAARDPSSLAAALAHLLADPVQRHQLSQAALQFSQQFTWSAIVEAHLNIYQQVVVPNK